MYTAATADVKKAISKAMLFGPEISVPDLATYAYGILKTKDLDEAYAINEGDVSTSNLRTMYDLARMAKNYCDAEGQESLNKLLRILKWYMDQHDSDAINEGDVSTSNLRTMYDLASMAKNYCNPEGQESLNELLRILKWYMDQAEQGVTESSEDNPVANAITRRILMQRTDLLAKYGPVKVMNAIDDVADFVGDVEEIGSSDVSGWIRQIEQSLKSMDAELTEFAPGMVQTMYPGSRGHPGSTGLNEFAPGAGGDDDIGDDPYKYPKPKRYNRSADYFEQFEADHFDREDFDDATGVFKGYWGNTQIAYFKFDNPARTGGNNPGMGWYYEPQSDGSNDTSAASAVDRSDERKQQELSMIRAFLKSGNRPNPDSQIGRLMKKHGMTEGAGQQLSVQQLAAISDEALDKAYGYGRSTPGNTFGWQANLKSAQYAKQMIDKGVTDIEAISDAIHKGWNVTAQAFVQNPEQFDDTAKLQAAGKLEAKLQQRAQLMKQNYAQLPDEEKEKDRVVARALLQALKGQQGVAEGGNVFMPDIQNTPEYKAGFETGKLPVPYPEGTQQYASYYKGVIDKATPNLNKGVAEDSRMRDFSRQDQLDHEDEIQSRMFNRLQNRITRQRDSHVAGVDIERWLKPYQILLKNNLKPKETGDRFEYLMQVALKLKGTDTGFDSATGMSNAYKIFNLDHSEQKLIAKLIRSAPKTSELEKYLQDSLNEDARAKTDDNFRAYLAQRKAEKEQQKKEQQKKEQGVTEGWRDLFRSKSAPAASGATGSRSLSPTFSALIPNPATGKPYTNAELRALAGQTATSPIDATAKKRTGGKKSGEVSMTPNAVRKRKARKSVTTAVAPASNPFGQMVNQLQNYKTSTGGQVRGTATGLKHTASPDNPNAVSTAADTISNPFGNIANQLQNYKTSTGGQVRGTATGLRNTAKSNSTTTMPAAVPAAKAIPKATPVARPNFAPQNAGYKSVNYAPNVKTGASMPKPLGVPAPVARSATKVTSGGPTSDEKAKLAQRIAQAVKEPVAEMLQMVETKEDVQRIKKFIDNTFVKHGAVNESAFVIRNQILAHVTQVGAQRRRDFAAQQAQ